LTAEAVELCEQCEGEGSIPVEDGIVSICDACGGHIGILSSFKRGRERRDDIHATASARRFLNWLANGPIHEASHGLDSAGEFESLHARRRPKVVCSSGANLNR
jgi:hypothetical protein